jgi:hypothetical protein
LWFLDEEMKKAGWGQATALGFRIRFQDGAKKEYLPLEPLAVNDWRSFAGFPLGEIH